MIEVEGLTKRFGEGDDAVEAVRGIDFSVGEGEIFGLLGANGAGKSTTVLMLATLLAPTSGEAKVAGFDLAGAGSSIRRSVGAALQETGLDPIQTGGELRREGPAQGGLWLVSQGRPWPPKHLLPSQSRPIPVGKHSVPGRFHPHWNSGINAGTQSPENPGHTVHEPQP